MTAVAEVGSTLLSKCLDLCQALSSQGQVFNFSVTIGQDFTFSMDTRSKAASPVTMVKKRTSPSTLRRNARRREEFLKRKQNPSSVNLCEVETVSVALSCDQCDYKAASERGLTQHKRVKHRATELASRSATPERQGLQAVSLPPLCWTPTGKNLWRVRRSLEKVRTNLRCCHHISSVIIVITGSFGPNHASLKIISSIHKK